MSCTSFLRIIPPTLILGLTIFSYYSYVLHFCVHIVDSVTKKTSYLFVYHVTILMFMWSFLATALKKHHSIPDEYRLSLSEHSRLLNYTEDEANAILKKLVRLRNLELYTCGLHGRPRYCKTCMLIKPDRAHHCTNCERCILKMDHHCPWVDNCIGFSNYKQFILMLFYTTLWCAFYAGTVAEYIIDLWKDIQTNVSKLLVGIGFLFAALLGMLVFFLFVYHLKLVFKNETTLEALRDTTYCQDNTTFDLGQWSNFMEVFGDNVCCWLFPVTSGKGNGYEFRVNSLI